MTIVPMEAGSRLSAPSIRAGQSGPAAASIVAPSFVFETAFSPCSVTLPIRDVAPGMAVSGFATTRTLSSRGSRAAMGSMEVLSHEFENERAQAQDKRQRADEADSETEPEVPGHDTTRIR